MKKRRSISPASIPFAFPVSCVAPCDVPSKIAFRPQIGAQVLDILKHLFYLS
ncbi:MAG: hypothetical protein GTN73_07145 [Candidatus Aminicenantes bacterium]|nr:hypothetical protein [Candidatus Aminicenantes bacterium]